RRRIVLSIVCALLAAVLWGLNFLAIYPVLKLLASAQTPQMWVADQIKETRSQIKGWEDESEKLAKDLQELEAMPASKDRDKLHRDKQGKQLNLQRKLERANRDVWWLLVAKKYIDAYLPNDCFQTLAWVFGLVIIIVAVKGCFEIWQEVLVGGVINLALFDLRNRFYRNSIHLDVDQFSEQ